MSPDPEGVAPLLAASRAAAAHKHPHLTDHFISLTQNDIVEMIFFPVVNEACRCLAEGVVVRASDLDVAAVLGKPAPLSHH